MYSHINFFMCFIKFPEPHYLVYILKLLSIFCLYMIILLRVIYELEINSNYVAFFIVFRNLLQIGHPLRFVEINELLSILLHPNFDGSFCAAQVQDSLVH